VINRREATRGFVCDLCFVSSGFPTHFSVHQGELCWQPLWAFDNISALVVIVKAQSDNTKQT